MARSENISEKPEPALLEQVEQVLDDSVKSFMDMQKSDGHWVFELEADVTIPAEYIMLNHFLDDLEPGREAEIAEYIRGTQQEKSGGWPLFYDGEMSLSATVKAYLALKLVGDTADEPHMKRACEAILESGGAENANVFTRYALAHYGQVPWHAVPVMP
ncbi:MAG: squalene--hopene cyclase, partial [Alphaproteobacteria bacterium]